MSSRRFLFTKANNNSFTATGGIITDSGSYRYHKFLTTGQTFSITSTNVGRVLEYVIVGGGGGGGNVITGANGYGGGGGAGGFVSGFTSTLNTGNFSILVGSGGTATPATTDGGGGNGNSSSFNSIVAYGGGGGGSGQSATTGRNGASSGGGGCQGVAGRNAGTLSPVSDQGNLGAAGSPTAGKGGGGGGGSRSAASFVNGGSGTTIWNLTLCVGGNGGPTSNNFIGSDGATNTGNGGNGSCNYGSGASKIGSKGGSGIVIIRYLI